MVIQISIGVGCLSVYFSGQFSILRSHDYPKSKTQIAIKLNPFVTIVLLKGRL